MFTEIREIVEGGLGNDGVSEDETLAVLHIEIAHRSELLLRRVSQVKKGGKAYSSGSIENLKHVLVIVDLDELTVGVLDGGIVLLDEDTLDELDLVE